MIKKCKHLYTSCDGKCLCGLSAQSKRESDTMKGRLDEELGELKFENKELCDRMVNFIEAELERIQDRALEAEEAAIDLSRQDTLAEVKKIVEGMAMIGMKCEDDWDAIQDLLKKLDELK